jgi:hypothetical protein
VNPSKILLPLALVSVAACGPKEETNSVALAPTATANPTYTAAPTYGPAPTAAPTYATAAPTYTAAPTAAPTATAPGQWTLPGIPTAAPAATGPTAGGATGGTATPLDPNIAAAATSLLGPIASQDVPGAAADGALISGNFQAGQTLEQAFTLQPGKCYSVVGASVGPGSQLDAQIIITTVLPGFQLPANNAAGQPAIHGSKVVLGAKSGCVKTLSPMPLTAKVVLTMARGAGMAAAQLYSK